MANVEHGHPKFGGKVKTLASLTAVGKETRDVLSSLGFDVTSTQSTFDQAMTLLKGHFDHEEKMLTLCVLSLLVRFVRKMATC